MRLQPRLLPSLLNPACLLPPVPFFTSRGRRAGREAGLEGGRLSSRELSGTKEGHGSKPLAAVKASLQLPASPRTGLAQHL